MSFANRLRVAVAHEDAVLFQLQRRGWIAAPFGQALLDDRLRDALRGTTSLLRWSHDMIAVHPDRPDVVALVDAKAGDMHIDTGRYDIEAKSVEAARQFHYMSDCHRATFVFSDFGVLDVETVIRTGFYMGSNRDWGSTRGSGTPFVLVDKEHAWPFYEEFGRDPDSEVGEP